MNFLRFFLVSLMVFYTNSVNGKDISEFVSNLLPGKGITEGSIQINDSGNPDLEILAVRDISASEMSNLFTQFGLHTQEVNNSDRFIANVGIGYRSLNEDKSALMGVNSFWDYDFEGHQRASFGLEAKAAMLDFTANSYHKISNMEVVDGTEEQVLSGYEINLASQIPYMPWSKINLQKYEWENEKASSDSKGKEVSLEMMLSPTIQFDIIGDFSDNTGVENEFDYKLTFSYPPKENQKSLQDGMIADLAFEKENMAYKLKEKVRRSNNMTVEIQGSIIITSK